MTIFCSHKLKDFLGPKLIATTIDPTPNFYGDWNGHLFNLVRQRNLILVNNKSYYSVVFPDIKKSDFEDFSTLFFARLTQQLLHDEVIDPSETLLTIQKYAPLIFTRTNNDKKTLGTMNEFIYNYRFSHLYPQWSHGPVLELNHNLNDSLTGAGRIKKFDYGRPIDDMRILLRTSH